MFQYFVFILKCSDDSYYTGITNDLNKRMEEHVGGLDSKCYTFKRRPLELKFAQEFDDALTAIYFEKRLKGWTRVKKKALIREGFDRLKIL